MKLKFERIQNIGVGNYPDLLHMYDNEAQAIYLKNGLMYGKTTYTEMGEWEDREFDEELKILNLDTLSHFEITKLQGFGAVGVVKSGDSHKLLIYEFQNDLSEYLNSGSIKHSIDNPISSFTLSLENAKNPDAEKQGNVAMSEKDNLINPGGKVIFRFGMGEGSPEYELGTFYVDRGNFTLLSETANINGRNLIGKVLKDQTLNENNSFSYQLITNILVNILKYANLKERQFLIETTMEERMFEFEPPTEVLGAINEILKTLVNWKIEEVDNRVVIGTPNYAGFENRGIYTFYRNKDVFSRQITRDDQQSYRKVCVHDREYNIAVYKDVEAYTGWNLQNNKTLFVEVVEGTSIDNATAIANEIANRLQNVGKVETFTGPFRPHLLCGDEALIMDNTDTDSLGLITEITHNFGKSGFYTSFTVDSGGMLGRGRLSDFILQIAKVGTVGSIAYGDIIPEPPVLADLTEYNATLASVTQANYTPESWAVYQGVVLDNVMTVNNTQTEVDIATIKIQIAQGKLVLI